MVSFALSGTIQAVRNAEIMDIFEGTGQIQRAIIAQDLTGLDCK